MEFKIQKVKVDLENMSAVEINLLGRGLLQLKEMDYVNTYELETHGRLFDQMCDLENQLIKMGEL